MKKLFITAVENLLNLIDFILAIAGGAGLMMVVGLLGYCIYDVATSDVTLQQEECFMSVQVSSCVRTQCPTVDSCSTEEHEMAWDQCYDECVAQ